MELEPERVVKKLKNGDDISLSCAMKISAEVAEQPRRKP
jgi:hypothetical protein